MPEEQDRMEGSFYLGNKEERSFHIGNREIRLCGSEARTMGAERSTTVAQIKQDLVDFGLMGSPH